jgi:predicted small metal-binding protein
MQRLECPIGDCGRVFESETEEQLMSDVETHAGESHPDVALDDETVADIRAQIKTV